MLNGSKVAVITGSGRGIGREISIRLAKEGFKIVINVKKRLEEAQETLKEVSMYSEGLIVQADVSTRDGCKKIAEETRKSFGRCDLLVNNAGLAIAMPFMECDDKLIEKIVSTDFLSVIYCTQEIVKIMPEGSSIVMMTSLSGIKPMKYLSLYGSLKAAVIRLTEYLALELSPNKIRVNSIAPSVVRTKMGDSLLNFLNLKEEEYADKYTLTGSVIFPKEIAATVVYLLESPNINGQTLIIDSGQSLMLNFPGQQ
ncbi:MAG: SDR family oxidoreductase [Candidatus Thermoplasmatota archaeon]|jgi:3-oxoacyl-[acyl-carrier protein] reductase|nr:SDR family oxidoreductase [Candidatus Thermoplasmatota archaeon]MCL5789404.1 SDR family oxidoreductase [Candidatus Thermoplasmatota archaeon]